MREVIVTLPAELIEQGRSKGRVIRIKEEVCIERGLHADV